MFEERKIKITLVFQDDEDYKEFWEYQKKGSPFKGDLGDRIECQMQLYSSGIWKVSEVSIHSERRRARNFKKFMNGKESVSGLDPMYDEFPE